MTDYPDIPPLAFLRAALQQEEEALAFFESPMGKMVTTMDPAFLDEKRQGIADLKAKIKEQEDD